MLFSVFKWQAVSVFQQCFYVANTLLKIFCEVEPHFGTALAVTIRWSYDILLQDLVHRLALKILELDFTILWLQPQHYQSCCKQGQNF